MPWDGSGNFTPAAAPNFPAVGGAVISATYYNAVINDIATGVTNAITSDGQRKPAAAINWNAQNLTNVATFGATTATFTNPLGIASGGLGVATVPANGQIPIGNGSAYVVGTITQGSGITITNGAGSITIANASPMTYPGAGIAVSTGAAWGTSLTAPTGAIVGTSDSQTLTNKTLTAPVINSATINLNCVIGTTGTATADTPGYIGIPQVGKTASYTLALTDLAKEIYITGTTAAQTITVPANGSVAFPIGAWVTITNDSNQNWSIAITTDTLFWSPSGGTGTRTLAAGGSATVYKKTATRWWITGVGLT